MSAVATKPSTLIRFADLSFECRPVRETLELVPNQGNWSEAEYLRLIVRTSCGVFSRRPKRVVVARPVYDCGFE